MDKILDYKQCSINEFDEAMSMKDINVKDIPDSRLYILYTKFKADANNISRTNSYTIGLSISSERKGNMYKEELIDRGIL